MINSDPYLNKVPPKNLDAEESILSAMMLDKNCLEDVFGIIKAEDFYKNSHKSVFSAMQCLFSANEPIDLVTVIEKLRKLEKLEEVGGATYLAQIIDTVPMAANVIHYSNIVKEKAILRGLIEKSAEITERCFADNQPTLDIVDFATTGISDISNSTFEKDDMKTGQELSIIVMDRVEQNSKSNGITGVPTGLFKLDHAMCGLQPASLITVAARPSMGKTAFAMTVARNAAEMGCGTVFIKSYETKADKLAQRIICAISGINSEKLRKGDLTKQEWAQFSSAADQYSRLNIKIDDNTKDSVSDIRRKAFKIKKEQGLGLIIIDHLTRMPLPKADRHDLRVGKITSDSSHMANDLNIPVMLLSQLNRSLEARDNKRPKLSDLKNSGSIEEDSDEVLFIYRDSVYNKEPLDYDEIILSKSRDGRLGMVKTKFLPETTRFIDYQGGF